MPNDSTAQATHGRSYDQLMDAWQRTHGDAATPAVPTAAPDDESASYNQLMDAWNVKHAGHATPASEMASVVPTPAPEPSLWDKMTAPGSFGETLESGLRSLYTESPVGNLVHESELSSVHDPSAAQFAVPTNSIPRSPELPTPTLSDVRALQQGLIDSRQAGAGVMLPASDIAANFDKRFGPGATEAFVGSDTRRVEPHGGAEYSLLDNPVTRGVRQEFAKGDTALGNLLADATSGAFPTASEKFRNYADARAAKVHSLAPPANAGVVSRVTQGGVPLLTDLVEYGLLHKALKPAGGKTATTRIGRLAQSPNVRSAAALAATQELRQAGAEEADGQHVGLGQMALGALENFGMNVGPATLGKNYLSQLAGASRGVPVLAKDAGKLERAAQGAGLGVGYNDALNLVQGRPVGTGDVQAALLGGPLALLGGGVGHEGHARKAGVSVDRVKKALKKAGVIDADMDAALNDRPIGGVTEPAGADELNTLLADKQPRQPDDVTLPTDVTRDELLQGVLSAATDAEKATAAAKLAKFDAQGKQTPEATNRNNETSNRNSDITGAEAVPEQKRSAQEDVGPAPLSRAEHPNAPGNEVLRTGPEPEPEGVPKRKWAKTGRKDSRGRDIYEPALDYDRGDGLLEWMAANGGINFKNLHDMADGDPALLKDPDVMNPLGKIGMPALRRNGGMTVEQAFVRMREDGWFPEMSKDTPEAMGANDAADMILDALNGNAVHHPYEGAEARMAEQAREQEASEREADEDMTLDRQAMSEQQIQAADEAMRAKGLSYDPADFDDAATVMQWAERALQAGVPSEDVSRAFVQNGDSNAAFVRQLSQLIEDSSRGTYERAAPIHRGPGNRATQEGVAAADTATQEQGFSLAADEQRPEQAAQVDQQQGLFAPATQGERVRAATEAKDAARNGRTGGHEDTGDGGLFDGERPEQTRVPNASAVSDDAARAAGFADAAEATHYAGSIDAISRDIADEGRRRNAQKDHMRAQGKRSRARFNTGKIAEKYGISDDGGSILDHAAAAAVMASPESAQHTVTSLIRARLDAMSSHGEQPKQTDIEQPRDLRERSNGEINESDLTPEEQALVARARANKAKGDQKAEADTAEAQLGERMRQENADQGERDAKRLRLRDVVNKMFPRQKVNFVHDEDGIAPEIRKRLKPLAEGHVRKGFYDPKTKQVYILTKHVRMPRDAAWVVAHEIGGHKAFRAWVEHHANVKVGSRGAVEALDNATDMARQNPTVAKLAKIIGHKRGEKNPRTQVEEALAELQAASLTGNWKGLKDNYGIDVPEAMKPSLKRSMANYIKRVTRIVNAIFHDATGEKGTFSDEDVRDMLADTLNHLDDDAHASGRADDVHGLLDASEADDVRQVGDDDNGPVFETPNYRTKDEARSNPVAGDESLPRASEPDSGDSILDSIESEVPGEGPIDRKTFHDPHSPAGAVRRQAVAARAEAMGKLSADGYSVGALGWDGTVDDYAGWRKHTLNTFQNFVDSWDPMNRTQQIIAGKLNQTQLAEIEDAYMLETLMHGREGAQLDTLERTQTQPLIDMMKRWKLTPKLMQDYGIARHAEERNREVAKINKAMPDAGSGMKTATAERILAGEEAGPYSGKKLTPEVREHLERAFKRIDALTKFALDKMEESGQITHELAEQLRKKYRYYVPIVGKVEGDDGFAPAKTDWRGRGVDMSGDPVKRALGRGEGNLPPVNMVAEIIGRAQRAIIGAEKARVGRAILRLAAKYPNPDIWDVEPVDMEWRFNDATGEAYLATRQPSGGKDVLTVVHNGTAYHVRLKDERLQKAVLNLDSQGRNWFVSSVGSLNRWLASVNTRFNPAFVPINMIRDAMVGMSGLASEQGLGVAKDAALGYAPAMRAMFRDIRKAPGDASVPDANKSWDDWAREGTENGMRTFLVNVERPEVTAEHLRRQTMTAMELMGEMQLKHPFRSGADAAAVIGRGLKPVQPLVHAVEYANEATENALRLSSYVALRKRGWSPARAAEYAKNLTVNFNRKGLFGGTMNSLFLFYNASVQGARRGLQLLKNPKMQMFIGSLAAMQGANTAVLMNRKCGKTGISDWDSIPEWKKQRSFIIALPGCGNYFALPMPYEFGWFTYAGGRMTQFGMNMAGVDDDPSRHGNVVNDLGAGLLQSFSPIPVDEGFTGLIPEAAKIPMQVYANKTRFGGSIYNDRPFAKTDLPAYTSVRAGTATPYVLAAKVLNRIGGGDEYHRPQIMGGMLDWSPDQLQFLTDQMTGGMGRFINRTWADGEKALAGNYTTNPDGSVGVNWDGLAHDLPIVRKFGWTVNTTAASRDRFYDIRDNIERTHRHMLNELEQGDVKAAMAVARRAGVFGDGWTFKRAKDGHIVTRPVKRHGRVVRIPELDTIPGSLAWAYKQVENGVKTNVGGQSVQTRSGLKDLRNQRNYVQTQSTLKRQRNLQHLKQDEGDLLGGFLRFYAARKKAIETARTMQRDNP